MSTVAEIMAAVERLDSAEYLKLRDGLDKAEERIWKQERSRAGSRSRKAKITDADIDAHVLKRRQSASNGVSH